MITVQGVSVEAQGHLVSKFFLTDSALVFSHRRRRETSRGRELQGVTGVQVYEGDVTHQNPLYPYREWIFSSTPVGNFSSLSGEMFKFPQIKEMYLYLLTTHHHAVG